jgi:hypothetical protein
MYKYTLSHLDYNTNELYRMTTDPLLRLKINSTFHRATLAHNIQRLITHHLPSQLWVFTHN